MTSRLATTLLMSSALVLGAGTAANAASKVPMNRSEHIRGVNVACAGVGNESQDNPRWHNYAVKLDFVGDQGQYLGNEHVQVRDSRGRLLNVRCHAPWVLMDLKPGRYTATARIPSGQMKHIRFTVPAHGQKRVVVRYSEDAHGNTAMQNASYRENGEPYNRNGRMRWQKNDHNGYSNTGYSDGNTNGWNGNGQSGARNGAQNRAMNGPNPNDQDNRNMNRSNGYHNTGYSSDDDTASGAAQHSPYNTNGASRQGPNYNPGTQYQSGSQQDPGTTSPQ